MLVDLVQSITRDGVRLDGIYQASAPGLSKAVGLDAFCLIHGTGGNFYSSSLFDLVAERLLRLGCGVLRINTRGHDGISTAVTNSGGKRLGAAYEVVDDSRHDLAAWIDWLRRHAGPRIGLIGHSLGAVKAIYTLANDPTLDITCLAALSPPRLEYSWFCSSSQGPEFLEEYSRAEHLVHEGRPATLMEVKLPLPFVITAAGYVEKYGPDERYNYLSFLPGISRPTLLTLGSVEIENNMAFRGSAEVVKDIAYRNNNLYLEVVPGADHFYTGVRGELNDRLEAWLRSMDRDVTWKSSN